MLPQLDLILDGSVTTIENHDNPKLMMALSIGLVNLLKVSNESREVSNVLDFSLEIPAEYAIMIVKDLQLNGIDIENSESWGEWVDKFAYLLA